MVAHARRWMGVLLAATPALAADTALAQSGGSAALVLGATCCAELEARIAELEATTARRGNRRVSVQITGLVNNAILGWDDGGEQQAYIVTNDNQRSHFAFVGKAALDADWEAGYAIDVGIRMANSKLVNQIADGGFDNRPPTGFDLRSSIWFLRNKNYGTGFVGTTFAATDRIANSNVTQTVMFDQYAAPENAGLGFFLRSGVDGQLTRSLLNWRRIIGAGGDQPGESQRGFSLLKYVSPTWNGFTAAADWVVTDFWDVALRYRQEIGGFDLAAGLGYLQLTPGSRTRSVCPTAILPPLGGGPECKQWRGSVSAKHLDSGLFINLGAALTLNDLVDDKRRFADTGVDGDERFVSGQVGLERQFFPLGQTTLYAGLYRFQGGAASALLVPPGDPLNPSDLGFWTVWNSDVTIWGGGLAQGIEAADTILYLTYRHISGDLTLRQLESGVASGPIAGAPLEDLDLLMTGAVIRF